MSDYLTRHTPGCRCGGQRYDTLCEMVQALVARAERAEAALAAAIAEVARQADEIIARLTIVVKQQQDAGKLVNETVRRLRDELDDEQDRSAALREKVQSIPVLTEEEAYRLRHGTYNEATREKAFRVATALSALGLTSEEPS